MTQLEIILSIVLFVSIAFNVGVLVYARAAIVRLLWVSEEMADLQNMVSAFSNHLQSIYETEMFYGDETLQSLVDHARSFDEQLETFEYLYSLVDDENIKTEEDEPEYDESEAAS
jgi:hypothetical protein